jgi:error-prone DNA polymerase
MTDDAFPAPSHVTGSYVELHCHSHFSLLDASSSPQQLLIQAQKLGMTALALTDHDSLAGAVPFFTTARRMGIHPVAGAEVTLEDGRHLTLLAETQQGYANLCQLISLSRLSQLPPLADEGDAAAWPGKVSPQLTWAHLADHAAGLLALTGCRNGPVAWPLLQDDPAGTQTALRTLREIYGPERLFVELQHHALPDDDWLVRNLLELARHAGLRTVATNNVHYATTGEGNLRDLLVAIRRQQPLTEVRRAGLLYPNRSYHLASSAEMLRRFREAPAAVGITAELARRCQASLDFSQQALPKLPIPLPAGMSEFEFLYQLCHQNLPHRYQRLTGPLLKQLGHELNTIAATGMTGFFLLVWDVVRFAREAGIRCQGRGSAANSIVAYLLGITNVEPLSNHLLFERFLSESRATMPDIDIDFAASRREEVIQYVYRTYGRAHTAMVCTYITFQARSAVRDVGKALDLPAAEIDRLVKTLDTRAAGGAAQQLRAELPADAPAHHPRSLLADLVEQIDGCPRHLSIHVGGMIITGPPLQQLVPLEPATMADRVIVQWDKNAVEDSGLIKLDLLGLRTLDLISEALTHIRAMGGDPPDLDNIPLDDPVLYRRLNQADTIGVFQVESRAQQQLLPRLAPRKFEDIIVSVSIVRPGPIQGGAVHPYLRRRSGEETVTYLHPLLEGALAETYGVLLYQEQVLRVAVDVAGFAPGEADLLRRALARSHSPEDLEPMRRRFLHGAGQRGVAAEIAEVIFQQIAGYAGYGFPKSHAAGFALISYQTLYLKEYYPIPFFCGLLNAQPMGFYSVEVVLGDAGRHAVVVLPPDVQRSQWPSAPQQTEDGAWALRVGLQAITGVGQQAAERLVQHRPLGGYADLYDLCRRTALPKRIVTVLIRAGACDGLGARRALLWRLGEITYQEEGFDLVAPPQEVELTPLHAEETTAWDYELMGWSPQGNLVQHYRAALEQRGAIKTWEAKQTADGRRVLVGGLIVIRQRPGTAKGILFLSLEDESGLLDVVVKPEVYEQYRDIIRGRPLVIVAGVIQRAGVVASLLAQGIEGMGDLEHE